MPRDYKVYLDDILQSIDKIHMYAEGMTWQKFAKDPKTQDAIVRNLEIIGEAVKKVPPEVQEMSPKIEWKKMAGLRDILIHEYSGVDLEIVWDVVANKLPPLYQEGQRVINL